MSGIASLSIDVGADVDTGVAGLKDVASAASGASRAVGDLGNDAAASVSKIGLTSDAADDLAGKTGKATGALGALAGGFEAVGLGAFATGLQTASVATDFMSGAGDSLNLIMESNAAKFLAAKVATIGQTIATGAASVATGVMTAGQWALNAALNANPVGLIVIGVVALVAGLVLAYKKSDTFRGIIKSVGKVGKDAISGITNVVRSLVGWVKDKLPGGFSTAKTLVVTYVKVMTTPIRTVVTVVSSLVSAVKDKLPGAFRAAKTALSNVKDALLSPFTAVGNAVQNVLDLISRIHLPKLPDLNPFSRTTATPVVGAGGGSFGGGGSSYRGGDQIIINVTGTMLDGDGVAKAVEKVMARRDRRFGR